MSKIRQTTDKFTLQIYRIPRQKQIMSVSAGLFPLCHGSLPDVTEEMPAKELCNIKLDYHVWLLLIISAVLYYLYFHSLW